MINKIKRNFNNMSITMKITLWYTSFVIILISAMLLMSFFITDKITGDTNKRELIKAVNEIISDPDEFEEFDDGIFFLKYDDTGEITAGNFIHGFDERLPLKESSLSSYNSKNGKFYYYDMKIYEDEWIRGVIPVSKITQETSLLSLIILILTPLLLIIIIYGGYKIIKSFLKPIEKISDTALEIQKSGNFSKRIELGEGKDEVHKMAETFNSMLNSLENFYLHEKKFSSDVSHELRTPVSVILTESQYSLQFADNMEEARESFEVIERQSKRMSELINQIMELSKIERKDKIILEKINISNIIEKIMEDYKNLLIERSIKINTYIQPNLFIYGEKVMIERLFDNLLNNAMKFTENKININLYAEEKKCILEVIDNGIGIPEKEKDAIWNRFYQINISRNKEINQGFGLGLSLVSKIVELHNASIKVDSEENKGTKFTIIFSLLNQG
ncbi:sensor histidine kinase [Leptotrichia sp. OH3620_COT-345]|uniref:HAMP domain-containing sensor histidine kinase n=1 Tax=Leptotrichia sp. OH3620_COT-345 TaxID=2491048 RepID=UPI000F64ACD0|nr:HAMP domain-containing sensor histidine kinase [Leptotrichia sp. OH3620_COT-345]RRD39897.1 sensor histidine kinase [Leptotrichia sp. OH3620_COT-345]